MFGLLALTADPRAVLPNGLGQKALASNSPQTHPGLYPAVPLTSKRPSETNPRPTLPPLSVGPLIPQKIALYYRNIMYFNVYITYILFFIV